MSAHDKVKQAREQLGLGQSEFARRVGVVQGEVSKLEKGQKKFIPNSYIEYLQSEGYDVNTIFNDKLQLRKLEDKSDFLQEPDSDYHNPKDQILINRMCEYVGVKNKEQLTDFFARLDEKGANLNQDLLAMRVERIELLIGDWLLEQQAKEK